MAKITERQKRFVDEYLKHPNAEEAAVKAGYSRNYARGKAYKMLANVGVQEYMSERIAKIDKEKIATQEELMQYWSSVIRGQSRSKEVMMKGIGNGLTEPITVEVEPAEKDKLKAAEYLAKCYGMFTTNVKSEVDQDVNLNISIDYGDENE